MQISSDELAGAIIGLLVVIGAVVMLMNRLGWLSFGTKNAAGCPDGDCKRTLLSLESTCKNAFERINKLEKFKEEVIVPNVGVSMCEQKHTVLDRALTFFMQKQDKLTEKWDKDHDIIVQAVGKLSNFEQRFDKLESKIDKMNGRE